MVNGKRGRKRGLKMIKVCFIYAPVPQNEGKYHALQISTNDLIIYLDLDIRT